MKIHTIFTICLMLIAVLNPFGNVPLFIGMTDGMEKNVRTKLFKVIAITGFCITLIFSLLGDFMMTKFYKITIDELKMAGGLILILMSIKSLIFPTPKRKSEMNLPLEEQIKKAVIPMAFPMLVGPGTLTTSLISKAEYGVIANSIAIFVTFIIIYFILQLGNYIEVILGKLVLYIMSRVMQIFIMAIGFRIFFSGFFEVIDRVF